MPLTDIPDLVYLSQARTHIMVGNGRGRVNYFNMTAQWLHTAARTFVTDVMCTVVMRTGNVQYV